MIRPADFKSFRWCESADVTSYEEIKKLRPKMMQGYNEKLMEAADASNNALFSNGDYITSKVDSYYIVGTNVKTIYSLIYDEANKKNPVWGNASNCGDGTVPTWSADLGGLYPGRTFYVEGVNHTNLVIDENVRTRVVNILKGKPFADDSE